MSYARRTIYFVVLVLLFSSCVGTGSVGTRIMDVSELTTPENVQKALIIIQDARLTYIQNFASEYKAGRKSEEDLSKIRELDKLFTSAWHSTDSWAEQWQISGSRPPFDLPGIYHTLIQFLYEYRKLSGE